MEKRMDVYAVKHKNETIRAKSRSGGIFTAISDIILEEGGVVYGCIMNDDLEAEHIRADSKTLRDKMRGSKYIQSRLGNTYQSIKNDLENGKKVLFSGTSCQVAGLKLFLKQDYDSLFCLDILCHGVPSRKVWKDYLKWQEKRKHTKVKSADFRNKKDFGWLAHTESLYTENNKRIDSTVFRDLFYQHYILRPSCYDCPFKSVNHPGDITIGDYWGVEKAAPEFNDNKGVSLVLVNSEKGKLLFEKCKLLIIWQPTLLENSLQPPLKGSFPPPNDREQFWADYHSRSFFYIAKKYGKYSTKKEWKLKLRQFVKKIVK